MDKQQEAYAGMFLKLKNFGAKNTAKLASIATVPPLFTTHSSNLADMFAADTGARADLRGIAIDKGLKRKTLEINALKISNALGAFAAIAGDNALLKRADFNTSAWYTSSEEELVTQATIVRDLGLANVTGLAGYAVLPADITALTTALNSFVGAISDPSLAADVRKEENGKLSDAIDKARMHLDSKLDVVMRVFESTDPVFYRLYLDARALDINGSTQAPTVIVPMEVGLLKALYTSKKYNPDTLFTFQNTGTATELYISLSTNDNTEGAITLNIPAGETRQRLASNLAKDGLFLLGVNRGNEPGELKVWVE
jgi:hypothetical protein